MSRARTESSRYSGLDGLRGIGALCVILVHVWLFEYADDGKPAKNAVDLVIGELRLALPMFFVLSAFLLVLPWQRAAAGERGAPDVLTYFKRRAGRILPGYWLALAGSVAVLWGSGNRLLPPLDHLPLFALFAQNQDPDSLGRLNPPMWTIGVEVSFYLVLPVIGWLILRSRASRGTQVAGCAVLVLVAIAFNGWAYETGAPRTLTTSLLSQAPYFALGIAAAAIARGRRVSGWWAVGGLALVAADAAWHITTDAAVEHWLTDVPAGIGFAMLVAAAPTALDVAPLRFLGRISYGLYLWHFPVIAWLRINDSWPAEGLLIAYLAVLLPTAAIASLSWYCVERPAVAWSHRQRGARESVSPRAVKA